MLKGGALLFAVAISLIIALMCVSLILLSSYVQLQTAQYLEIDKLRINSTSGINLLLSQYDLPRDQRVIIDLYGSTTDSVELYKSYWGVFDLISVRAFSRDKNFSQTALEGYELEEAKRFALYLADNDKSLSVCGKTVVSGKSFLPKAGVKRAYIEGQYFSGDKLINGEIHDSKKQIPALNKELINRINANYQDYAMQNETLKLSELFSKDTVSNSFSAGTLVFYDRNNIELNNFISGNVIIVSDEAIVVGSNAKLFDIILQAPKITIAENFHGSCQIIASEEIEIKSNCILDYPSGVMLYHEGITGNGLIPTIKIAERSTINGIVILSSSVKSKITIDKEAQVYGQVYSSSGVDLKGSIYGSLICSNISLTTPSSVYENHLLNATVDINKLSKYFAGINIDETYSSKKIIKWLY